VPCHTITTCRKIGSADGPLVALNADPWFAGNHFSPIKGKSIPGLRDLLVDERLVRYSGHTPVTLALRTRIHYPEPFVFTQSPLVPLDLVHDCQRSKSHRNGRESRRDRVSL